MTNQTNSTGIETLEPAPVWRLFAEMAAVPRPSKKEEKIRAHVRRVAEGMGFSVREDAVGNMVVEVPATPGCENAPITVLQGHVDMVPEKNAGTKHDFDRDPIRLVIDKDAADGQPIVRADGTTLGADNGIGVCMALAAASLPEVRHGPLELLMTVDEEAGMTGAKVLQPDFFKGKRMLNLDSEEDDAIYIGCAGGCDTNVAWEFKTASVLPAAETCRVTVSGLRGGHTGGDIHLNVPNAIKLLAQTLCDVADVRLIDVAGGSVRNAIPREASATVTGPAGTIDALSQAASAVRKVAVEVGGQKSCAIGVEKVPGGAAAVVSREDSRRLLETLIALPHGVLAVVPDIAGLVQTSNSVSTITTNTAAGGGAVCVTIGCLSRSSSATDIDTVVRQLAAVGRLGGAVVESGNDYPGWQPNMDSPTLATCRRVYEALFGEAPGVTAIHAGLECGIIGQRMGGMDMVSFGPRIEGAHSPDERIWIASVQKSWKYLTAVLAELAKG